MTTYVLMFYLATYSASGGMTLMAAEFNSKGTCEAAGNAAEKKFSGIYARPYWTCVPK